jgi:hypothetical protein
VERISRSWTLVKASWRVLRADKELMVFPVVSTILTLVVLAVFAIPVLLSNAPERWENEQWNLFDLVLAAVFYLISSSVIIFCNAALVGAADIRLKGGDPTVRDGFRIAFAHLPAIIGWSLITATVGLALRVLAERGGLVGAIGAMIGGIAWALITFLVVPILVIDGVGPMEAIRRSGGLLRRTWGEQIVGNASVGLIFGLLAVAIAIVGAGLTVGLLASALPLAIVIGVVTVVALVAVALVAGTLSGIFTVALYRYATTGDAGPMFPVETMDSAFRRR